MRFLIALTIVAMAYAGPLGYTYNPGHSDIDIMRGAANLSPFIDSGSSQYAPEPEYIKDIYSFTAPEHEFDDSDGHDRAANSLRKNLRVVFIKGPENTGLEDAVVNLAKQAGEQRTAIYVLNKQADLSSLVNKFNAANNVNAQKPEVHFVKYRTPEDAANAQKAIQSQYDNLSGPSQSHNGGVAPVLNFASSQQVHTPTPKAPGHAYLPASVFRLRY